MEMDIRILNEESKLTEKNNQAFGIESEAPIDLMMSTWGRRRRRRILRLRVRLP